MTTLNQLKDKLTTEIFGMSVIDAHRANICINCKHVVRDERGEDAESTGEPGQIYSDAGFNAYCNSALCETCFDNITGA